jgi:hypothetical protein
VRGALATVLAITIFAPGVAAQAAAPAGRLQGVVRGLPPHNTRIFATARAVDRVTSRVVAATVLSNASRRYRLTPPLGRYLVAVDGLGAPGGAVSRISRTVRVRSRHTARKDLTARAAQAAAPVVGIDEVNLTSEAGLAQQTLKLRALVIAEAFREFSPKGIKVVDDSAQVVAAIQQEEKLAKEGRSDTPFVAHPLKPTVRLGGSGTLRADGTVDLELKLVRPDGTLVASKSFSGKPTSMDGFGAFIKDAASSFAADNVGHVQENPPTAGPGIHVVIGTHMDGVPGGGTLTITPPGRTFTDPSGQVAFDGSLPLGSTIHAEAKPADAHTYFAGWSTSQCGETQQPNPGDYTPTWDCTVGQENASDMFSVNFVPEFDDCPPPGTYVFGPGATCPGVIPAG